MLVPPTRFQKSKLNTTSVINKAQNLSYVYEKVIELIYSLNTHNLTLAACNPNPVVASAAVPLHI